MTGASRLLPLAVAAILTAACGAPRPSPAELAKVESVWQSAADSATRSLCADSLSHGRSRCTTIHGPDTLFIWGDSTRHPAGFVRIHPVDRRVQDSTAGALRDQLTLTLGAGIQCTARIHGWQVGHSTAMVVQRPDGGVVLLLGTHEQAAIICPGINDRE